MTTIVQNQQEIAQTTVTTVWFDEIAGFALTKVTIATSVRRSDSSSKGCMTLGFPNFHAVILSLSSKLHAFVKSLYDYYD